MNHGIILILDFGSRHTQLIARRLQMLGEKKLIERGDLTSKPPGTIDREKARGVLVMAASWVEW